jgi:hypothetical protein
MSNLKYVIPTAIGVIIILWEYMKLRKMKQTRKSMSRRNKEQMASIEKLLADLSKGKKKETYY